MKQSIFISNHNKAYHKGMLILKFHPPSLRTFASNLIHNIVDDSLFSSPGLNILSKYEKAGMIKKIIPLSRPQVGARETSLTPFRMVHSLISSIDRTHKDDNSAGVNIIEVDREEDITTLQKTLATDPHIEFVSRLPIRYLNVPTSNTSLSPPTTMWNLRKIKWEEARSLPNFKDSTDVKIAVLDTGIDINHPDLNGRIDSYMYMHPDLPSASSDKDFIGHGTHVSGTIGALINNNLGINGICKSKICVWKIFDDKPDYDEFYNMFSYYVDPIMYRRALAECLEADVKIINLSIGGPGTPDPQERALINQLISQDKIIVASMGNDGEAGSPVTYPAAIEGVIAVGATTLNDDVASFSTRGNYISLCAPGVAIWSTLPTYSGQFGFRNQGNIEQPTIGLPIMRETCYDAWEGTSMAAPHVSAASALLVSNKGIRKTSDLRIKLMETTEKPSTMNNKEWDANYGSGVLNLYNLLK